MHRLLYFCLIIILPAAGLAYDWEYLSMSGESNISADGDPIHSRIIVGTAEGFHYLDEITGVWTDRDQPGYPGRHVWTSDFSPTLPDRILTGRVHEEGKGYIELSDDLGVTGTTVYEFISGRVTDLTHDDLYHYACTYWNYFAGEMLRSADDGETWEPLEAHWQDCLTAMAVSPRQELFLAGNAGVLRSNDHGLSWKDFTGNLPVGDMVLCLAVQYHDGPWPDIDLWAGNDNGVFHCTEAGQWEQVYTQPCRQIITAPHLPGFVALATVGGRILVSNDYGVNWENESGDLIGLDMVGLVLSPWHDTLYCVAPSAGAFRHEMSTTAVNSPPSPNNSRLCAVPNPFNPKTHLTFELERAGSISLHIFDISGREVNTLASGPFERGIHSLPWDGRDRDGRELGSGVYLIRLDSEGRSRQTKAILLR
ncbi:MAG: T9SS type A sorting domain-containing protein [bacterium]|nr:T9SS type A sorting domain-containing protein [bacterium]